MKITPTSIPDILLFEPKIYKDTRGSFFESFNSNSFYNATGMRVNFVQDNQSSSLKQVIRGMHYQINRPQDKLIRVLSGAILDVAIDLRRSSPSFGKAISFLLSSENNLQLWIPKGFAHGFLVLSDQADVLYKVTDFWFPEDERCIYWNDPAISHIWPKNLSPTLSEKDRSGFLIEEAEVYT